MSKASLLRGSAIFSPCRRYRYCLTRTWAPGDSIVFIGLNPSTADETVDDPTIKRCINFGKTFECGQLQMVNLFGYRSTDPKGLLLAGDPIGHDNDHHIEVVCDKAALIVVAWGAFSPDFLQPRLERLLPRLPARKVHCLGLTKTGAPRHPLYVPNATALVRYRHTWMRDTAIETPREIAAERRVETCKAKKEKELAERRRYNAATKAKKLDQDNQG